MKRIISMLLSIMLCFSLLACTSSPNAAGVSITYHAGDGVVTNMPSNRTNVAIGSVIERPSEEPLKDGYSFVDWFDSATGGERIEFPFTALYNVDIYAQWQPASVAVFAVNFYANAGIDVVSDMPLSRSNLVSGSVIERPNPAPSREGYLFANWYTLPNGGSLISFPITVTESQDIFAHWNPISQPSTYTVNFNQNTTAVVDDMPESLNNITGGTQINQPSPEPSRDGYTFLGWSESISGGVIVAFPFEVTNNLVLYAQWRAEFTPSGYFMVGSEGFYFLEDAPTSTMTHSFTAVFDLNGGVAAFYFNGSGPLNIRVGLHPNPADGYHTTTVYAANMPVGRYQVRFEKYTSQSYWSVNISEPSTSTTDPGYTMGSATANRIVASSVSGFTPETMPAHTGSVDAVQIAEYTVTAALSGGDELRFWIDAGGIMTLIEGALGNMGVTLCATPITISAAQAGNYRFTFKKFDRLIGGSCRWKLVITKI